jgi:hypothetical protein
VLYDGEDGKSQAFKCLHAHCIGRRLADAVQFLQTAAVSVPEPPPTKVCPCRS